MRKLFIGIAAIALLGLLGMPAMAVLPLDTETVDVTITVDPYGAIIFSPATLGLTVTDPWNVDPHPAGCCNSIEFTVLCNLNTTLKVTAATLTLSTAPPGGTGKYYPTATGTTGAADGHQIGFGVALENTSSTTYVPWPDTNVEADAYVETPFVLADVPLNLADRNGRITICSYMDSARGSDALAPPGLYYETLTLTLSAP